MGDAAGIGPEIIVKALRNSVLYDLCRPLVIGDLKALERIERVVESGLEFHRVSSAATAGLSPGRVDCLDLDVLPAEWNWGELSARTGDAAFCYLVRAIELAKQGDIDAICTAPLNKEALHLAGHHYPGHTEILADLTGTSEYAMMLKAPKLKVIHLTGHVGLLEAIERITPERTFTVIRLVHDLLYRATGQEPHIGVCGINPHAGENGLFGNREEETKLAPGIAKAAEKGIQVTGPLPADTLFYRAVRGDFDVVVACYHDQGHCVVKALGLEEGVNITVGLEQGIIRTSVDHGTAFDIAGKNLADEGSMIAALRAAVELTGKRLPNREV
jgi:4-hydroxythreonine-4-phosphate dehydrogenase